ncbi:MAG: hypothetical protein FWF56_05945 [Firmicutes bacterium]|nr:hypothetical protein [Bacillota bacterium]MCL1953549.1 hypothetical protein [Bacillota bacterium]
MKTDKKKFNFWPIKIVILSFVLAIVFGVFSELVLDGAGIAISIVVLLIFLFIALLADLIGTAATACDKVSFLAMASRRVKGAKSSIWLIKRQDKVANVCNDIIGDISAIISGAVGAGLSLSLVKNTGMNMLAATVLISALIASITVGGKSMVKTYAIANSHKIMRISGRVAYVFGIGK